VAQLTGNFFLTEFDSKARIKGSRDPLGFMSIWTRFGREVVGNLTTVTLSVRSFTTLLLGLDLIEELIESSEADVEQRVDLFIKFEQLAAYSRVAAHSGDTEVVSQVEGEAIRGIERVRIRLGPSQQKPVSISASPGDQILASQKVYGIWGLFPVAARASGLLRQDDLRLSDEARRFVAAEYRSGGARATDWSRKCRPFLLKGGRFAPTKEHRPLAEALAARLRPELSPRERDFYGETLVLGRRLGDEKLAARQESLWRLLERVNGRSTESWARPFDLTELERVLEAMSGSDESGLAVPLEEIRTVEPLLAAASSLFRCLLDSPRQRLNHVLREIEATWGKRGLRHLREDRIERLASRLGTSADPEGGSRLVRLAGQLARGDYAGAVRSLLEQNEAVMKGRGAAPWILVERGILDVREREAPRPLPPLEVQQRLWTNPYFLNSLKIVGAKVYGKAAA